MTKPKVLISDKMDPNAARIFEERGCDVDVIAGHDPGRAQGGDRPVRRPRDPLGDQGDQGDHRRRHQPQGDRPRRHRRRQRRHPLCLVEGHRGDEHAVRQLDHHRRARDRADVRARPPAARGQRPDPGRPVAEERLHGRRGHRQDARPDRRRQHRLDRRRPRARAADEGRRLRSVPVARARGRDGRREGRARPAARARRLHHAAHAADRPDAQHPQPREPRQDPARACASSTARAAG